MTGVFPCRALGSYASLQGFIRKQTPTSERSSLILFFTVPGNSASTLQFPMT